VPNFNRSAPGCCLSSVTRSATSPSITLAFQVVCCSVRDATCLGRALMRSV
jgi:hypothetical protein